MNWISLTQCHNLLFSFTCPSTLAWLTRLAWLQDSRRINGGKTRRRYLLAHVNQIGRNFSTRDNNNNKNAVSLCQSTVHDMYVLKEKNDFSVPLLFPDDVRIIISTPRYLVDCRRERVYRVSFLNNIIHKRRQLPLQSRRSGFPLQFFFSLYKRACTYFINLLLLLFFIIDHSRTAFVACRLYDIMPPPLSGIYCRWKHHIILYAAATVSTVLKSFDVSHDAHFRTYCIK